MRAFFNLFLTKKHLNIQVLFCIFVKIKTKIMKQLDKIISYFVKKNQTAPVIVTNYPDDSFFTYLKEVADNNSLDYIEVDTNLFNDRAEFIANLSGMPIDGKKLAKSFLIEGERKLINFRIKHYCQYIHDIINFVFSNEKHIVCITLEEIKEEEENILEPEDIFGSFILNRSLLFDYKKLNY